jgi:hypothetical protein
VYASFGIGNLRAMVNLKPAESQYNSWGKYGLRNGVASAAAYLGLTTLLGGLIQDGFRDRTSDDQSHNQALFIAAESGDKAMIRLLSGPNYAKYISTYYYGVAILCAAECGKLDTVGKSLHSFYRALCTAREPLSFIAQSLVKLLTKASRFLAIVDLTAPILAPT